MIRILAILFFFFLLPTLQAQNQAAEDALLSPNDLLDQDLDGIGNSTYVQQVGTENSVDITQRQLGADRINLVRVLQSGDYNEVYILQNGSGNQTAVVQRGSENFYQLSVDGLDNQMAIIQEGDRNRIIQNLENSDQLKIELVQQGSDNEIIQNLDSENNQQFKVIQIGDGLRAIINQNPER